MYEHMRNDMMFELSKYYGKDNIETILYVLDKVSMNYEMQEKTTELAIVDNWFPNEAKLFIQSLKLEGKSNGTIKLYKLRLKQFFEIMNKPIQDIKTNDVRAFLAMYQEKRKIKDCSLDKFRQIIHAFFHWCVNEEYLFKNPCANIKSIKFEDSSRKALTRFQLEQLRRVCKTKRERAIIEVLYSTGVRVTELVNMKRSQINPYEKCIEVIGKGKKKNIVYFNESAQIALDEYDDERDDDSDWLFVGKYAPYNKMSANSVEKIFRTLSERVGFYVCPHIMRHTHATLMLQSGCPIDIVQKNLCHASVATTQRYAKTSEMDVKNAHVKYVI